jgi:hypothetical protein
MQQGLTNPQAVLGSVAQVVSPTLSQAGETLQAGLTDPQSALASVGTSVQQGFGNAAASVGQATGLNSAAAAVSTAVAPAVSSVLEAGGNLQRSFGGAATAINAQLAAQGLPTVPNLGQLLADVAPSGRPLTVPQVVTNVGATMSAALAPSSLPLVGDVQRTVFQLLSPLADLFNGGNFYSSGPSQSSAPAPSPTALPVNAEISVLPIGGPEKPDKKLGKDAALVSGAVATDFPTSMEIAALLARGPAPATASSLDGLPPPLVTGARPDPLPALTPQPPLTSLVDVAVDKPDKYAKSGAALVGLLQPSQIPFPPANGPSGMPVPGAASAPGLTSNPQLPFVGTQALACL